MIAACSMHFAMILIRREALASLSRLAGEANTAADRNDVEAMATARANLLDAGALLGLLTRSPAEWEQGGSEDDKARIDGLVQQRLDARAAKDWARADEIREPTRCRGG